MPERFPLLVGAAALLFALGMVASFAIPLVPEAGQVAHIKELTADE